MKERCPDVKQENRRLGDICDHITVEILALSEKLDLSDAL